MNDNDSRLKWVVSFFDKQTEQLAGTYEVPVLSGTAVRRLFAFPSDAQLVGMFPLGGYELEALGLLQDNPADTSKFDYFLEVVVRAEFVSSYYSTAEPPYPPPEELLAFPAAGHTKPHTPLDYE